MPTSSISGNVGLNDAASNYAGLTAGEVAGTIYASNISGIATAILDPTVQANLSTAYTGNIPGQPATASIGPALDGLTVTPGVYDIGSGRLNGGVLHLNGAGIYIFRASADFISSGSIDLQNGASACNVYWRVQTLATINGSSFVGTILAGTGVHFGANVTLNGRALAVGGDVTMISDTITGPSCVAPTATINVVKTVINDSGTGNRVVADFPLFVNGTPVTSGVTNTFTSTPTYTVTESADSHYAASFSGDCNASGVISYVSGAPTKFCIITNNDIPVATTLTPPGGYTPPPVPPLISLVKVPSPLALPAGPGAVTYGYTVKNIGIVPINTVKLIDDSCNPVAFVSGDTNNDSNLDVTETWTYQCSTTLSATHTNSAVVTGWANGVMATDVATATVVVGVPAIVPPLIHVTKIPSPLVLPLGAGTVTYNFEVTNPGTVALSNVLISDDKCSPVNYISGDVNNNLKLDPTEKWVYTCKTNLSQTTTNTVKVSGDANGITARDLAVATVIVTTPKLPNTGFGPNGQNNVLYGAIVVLALILISTSIILISKKRKI